MIRPRSRPRIRQRLGTSAILIARTQDTWPETTCAGARNGRGGSGRGFRSTMQAEAYIVIIIISPLDIKDLSFSLFASLSLLPTSAQPLVDHVLSPSASFPVTPFPSSLSLPPSFLVFLPDFASLVPLPLSIPLSPPMRCAWLWGSEK